MRQAATLVIFACLVLSRLAGAQVPAASSPAPALNALGRLPVREVTIFKDGYAFVVHEGVLPVDDGGRVSMDYLPTPVLGTFWLHSADPKIRVTSVVASQRRVRVDRTALDVRELIEGNIGGQATITEAVAGRDPISYAATIVDVPARSGEELARTLPPNSGERLPQKGSLALLKTDTGVRAVPIDRILDVTFRGTPRSTVSGEEFRNLLTLQIDRAGRPGVREAAVGMVYVQHGLRWIPSYKVDLDGQGRAKVTLQATLINELVDLENATAQLVVGVPSFAFKDTVDPMALQQVAARVSGAMDQSSLLNSRLSNALMTQVASTAPGGGGAGGDQTDRPTPDLGAEITGSERHEDLFVYTLEHVTLRKGQRMIVPVHELSLKYRDVYTVDIPFALPAELPRSELRINDDQQRELVRALREPKTMHKVRLTNASAFPLTTAPALTMRDGRVLSQGLMPYTSVGGVADLAVTQALDVAVTKNDKEIRRIANAENWQGHSYGRIDLAGTVTVTNHRDRAAEVEVRRYALGKVTEASSGGTIQMMNVFEDRSFGDWMPAWWSWSWWPDWMAHFNGVGRITWTVTLEPGKSADLTYGWNYYWR